LLLKKQPSAYTVSVSVRLCIVVSALAIATSNTKMQRPRHIPVLTPNSTCEVIKFFYTTLQE
jgi:hypothetical protein